MSTELKLRCQCGKVQGRIKDVAPNRINRVVCHCKFCAAYARALGVGDTVLDSEDGTEVLNVSPQAFEITEGLEHIACGRLTSKGAMRWHAGCCKTPIANGGADPKMPFLGVVRKACIDPASLTEPVEDCLGPIRAHINHGQSKQWAKDNDGTTGSLISMLLRFAPTYMGWKLKGYAKHIPFFTEQGQPIVEPHRLEWPQDSDA